MQKTWKGENLNPGRCGRVDMCAAPFGDYRRAASLRYDLSDSFESVRRMGSDTVRTYGVDIVRNQ